MDALLGVFLLVYVCMCVCVHFLWGKITETFVQGMGGGIGTTDESWINRRNLQNHFFFQFHRFADAKSSPQHTRCGFNNPRVFE